MPADRHKVRAQASQESGCCLLWKNNNKVSCNISVKELAAVHFTVYSDGVQGMKSVLHACDCDHNIAHPVQMGTVVCCL